jgi:hypothetical protein
VCATTDAAAAAGPFITLILAFISRVFIPAWIMPACWTRASSSPRALGPGPAAGLGRPRLSTGITAIDLAALAAWGAAGLAAALASFRWEPHDNW